MMTVKREELTNRIQESFFELAPDMFEQTMAAIEQHKDKEEDDNVVVMPVRKPLPAYVLAASVALFLCISGFICSTFGLLPFGTGTDLDDKRNTDLYIAEDNEAKDQQDLDSHKTETPVEDKVIDEMAEDTDNENTPSKDNNDQETGLIAEQGHKPESVKESGPVEVASTDNPVQDDSGNVDHPDIPDNGTIIVPPAVMEDENPEIGAIGTVTGITEEPVVIEEVMPDDDMEYPEDYFEEPVIEG